MSPDINQIDFNTKRRRIRCLGHIINLSLQSFLLARSKEALSAALEATENAQNIDPVDNFTIKLAGSGSLTGSGTQQDMPNRRARKGKPASLTS